ncbi:hypothetical protein CHS0354_013453 [Potamilus streckersoni]|uniref:Uncharacterized protein n=1 Tax=Potamilus streckersoni TaxID=2493646 RepID=A0AAE0VL91_9BIVA|nr:hypothetical protein CHS0354_013453 [Potamilus streckersoni]
MSAFKNAFQCGRVTGYYFHLPQRVLRKVNEIIAKAEYETHDELIRFQAALTHVPVDYEAKAFDILATCILLYSLMNYLAISSTLQSPVYMEIS